MSEKEKSRLHAKLFLCQKELDTKLKGEQLIGAMRQLLHSRKLVVELVGCEKMPDETSVFFRYAFVLRHEEETDYIYIDSLRSDFKDPQEQLQFAWETYLHGLFGIPKIKEPAKPIGVLR